MLPPREIWQPWSFRDFLKALKWRLQSSWKQTLHHWNHYKKRNDRFCCAANDQGCQIFLDV
jgi:hypothetical protein